MMGFQNAQLRPSHLLFPSVCTLAVLISRRPSSSKLAADLLVTFTHARPLTMSERASGLLPVSTEHPFCCYCKCQDAIDANVVVMTPFELT